MYFLPDESPAAFTKRIISLCEFIFIVRPTDHPGFIIGDCALHHWNKATNEIETGGTLLKEYWGKGFMQAAFELLTAIAKEERGVGALIAKTQTANKRAVRFAEKTGFVIIEYNEVETILRKEV